MLEKIINQYRIKLMDMRLEINRIIDRELAVLDEDSLRQAKEGNGMRALPPIEESPIPIEIILNHGKPERD